MALYPDAGVEKFGYLMAMGFGVAFVVAGGKAMVSKFGNLAILMATLGFSMILVSIVATPDAVFVASALEDNAKRDKTFCADSWCRHRSVRQDRRGIVPDSMCYNKGGARVLSLLASPPY